VTAYAGASPIHPLGLYTVSTTNGRLPASISGTRQNAAAPVEAPDVIAPELKAVPDVEVPDATDPELTTVPDSADPEPPTEPEGLPPVTTALSVLPPPGLLAMLPLPGLDNDAPALPPVFEPAAPASEP
jgi:hypothetical protein